MKLIIGSDSSQVKILDSDGKDILPDLHVEQINLFVDAKKIVCWMKVNWDEGSEIEIDKQKFTVYAATKKASKQQGAE